MLGTVKSLDISEIRPKTYSHIAIMQENQCPVPKHTAKIECRRRGVATYTWGAAQSVP